MTIVSNASEGLEMLLREFAAVYAEAPTTFARLSGLHARWVRMHQMSNEFSNAAALVSERAAYFQYRDELMARHGHREADIGLLAALVGATAAWAQTNHDQYVSGSEVVTDAQRQATAQQLRAAVDAAFAAYLNEAQQ